MSKLYLFNYNNYFNRIIKRGVTLSDYGTPVYSLSNTNFQENDGVTTSHVVNYNAYDGDYIVITDDNDVIKSRWFVVENVKQRGGQHSLSLRRDLIADYYNSIINAPALINRAMITNPDSALLFNTEGFSFNQIKRSEALLKDKTKIPWYALYFAKNTPTKTASFHTGTADFNVELATTLQASVYNPGEYTNIVPTQLRLSGFCDSFEGGGFEFKIFENERFTSHAGYGWSAYDYVCFKQKFEEVGTICYSAFEDKFVEISNVIKADETITSAQLKALNNIGNNNSILVKDVSGDIYKVYLKISSRTYSDYQNDDYATKMKQIINTTSLERDTDYTEWGTKSFYYEAVEYTYTVTAELQETNDQIQWTLFDAGKSSTKDADYNVILIPYGDITASYKKGSDFTFNDVYGSISKLLIDSIIKEYGSTGYLYDIQLIPYFPYQYAVDEHRPGHVGELITLGIDEDSIIPYEGAIPDSQFYAQTDDQIDENIFMIYLTSCNFSVDIQHHIPSYNTAIEKKIHNECYLYRLCSPNYNGAFEFSVAKNNGVDYFNADITLRPYNPYIHLNPNFKALYGSDFNDARGLICQGDFSLPIVTDQFKQYEYQNKNYLNVFNRQIEHMDFEFSKARTENLFGAITGTVGAGVSGGLTGGMVGGPLGVGIGAGIGTVASAIGGAVDYNILKERQAESKDLVIDNFNYRLGNIKALGYTINKVTPLTFNNKLFPFIETYSCTQEEEDILRNKITYNSMKVNAIGTIAEYLQPERKFISASLIRLEDLNVPTHEANEIYDEIMKGVYI